MEAFTHIERVGRFCNELRPEPAKKREHLFPCRIDEGHVGYIDEESYSVKAARYERASVLGVVAGESAVPGCGQAFRDGLSRLKPGGLNQVKGFF